MKIVFFRFFVVCLLSANVFQNNPAAAQKEDLAPLKLRAREAKSYCLAKGLNTDFCILIDLAKHSGLKRFFVWDLKKDTIVERFMVSHGCGTNPWSRDNSKALAPVSNRDGSHCSSVGKYIIGERAHSEWGINVKYFLYGQDKTNNNAVKRQIVFHSWEAVSDTEVFPRGTPEGWGCPAISNNSMLMIDKKIKASSKRVLMWVFQ